MLEIIINCLILFDIIMKYPKILSDDNKYCQIPLNIVKILSNVIAYFVHNFHKFNLLKLVVLIVSYDCRTLIVRYCRILLDIFRYCNSMSDIVGLFRIFQILPDIVRYF